MVRGKLHIQDAGTFYRRKKPSYDQLHFTRYKAAEDGLFYFWIDICCIKRSDSTELQRSLNSMFYWYQRAARCYAYLEGVSEHDITEKEYPWKTAFSRSKWFKRGWTLQELTAPKSVMFYSKEGKLLGDKRSLAETLAAVTGIPTPALLGADLSRFSKQARLSWAHGRVTKIPEDAAYILIGIFGATLPMFYADGDYEVRKRAALEELELTIERASIRAGTRQDLVRIGGASWDDLRMLDKAQLEQLDWELSAYAVWLFGEVELPLHKSPTARLKHGEASKDQRFWAEQKLRVLLAKFGVDYDHSAHYRNYEQEDSDLRTAPNIARVQRLEAWLWSDSG